MPDVHGSGGLAGSAPKIAIGAAIAALLTSMIAVIVVASRGGGEAPATAAGGGGSSRAGSAGDPPPLPRSRRVEASDVVKLRREVVTLARESGKVIGVKVTDEEVRDALELEEDDVITSLAGRTIEREFDVFEAMLALKRLRASTVYVEVLRGGHPLLVVWKVDGDLQAARAPDRFDPRRPRLGGGGLGGGGSLGIIGGGASPGIDPFTPDPLADTVKRIDDLSYEVPRSTVERVFASPSAYAQVARTYPARRRGGFQVFGVRPGSIVAAIGIASMDTIRAINGNPVSSIEEAVDLYPQIKDAAEWRIDLERRGRPVLIKIAIK